MTELIRFPFARSGGKFAVETGVNIFTASEKNKTLECPINSEMVYLTVTPQFRLSGHFALYDRELKNNRRIYESIRKDIFSIGAPKLARRRLPIRRHDGGAYFFTL